MKALTCTVSRDGHMDASSRPIVARRVSLNLGCRQLSALYYVTMDSGIKGRALTRFVIFPLSLAELTDFTTFAWQFKDGMRIQ